MVLRNFANDEIYHVFNRGVDKRAVYTNTEEYTYFIHLLFALNDTVRINNVRRNYTNKNLKTSMRDTTTHNEGGRTSFIMGGGRERLVDVLAFVLMPNHYHLLLKQRVDGGVSKFMQKLGTGYTMFFNEKHRRSGVLFQGKYKAVHMYSDRLLLYIPHYIHLNPVRHKKFKNLDEKIAYLNDYKWSSYIDYVYGGNFPSVTQRELVLSIFEGSRKYQKDITSFINDNQEFASVDSSVLID